jgi:predicted transcriptional regulator
MEVHLTADQQAKLARLATDKGCDTDTLALEAIEHYLEQESRFVEAVNLGEAELERGDYLTHEEVGARIEQMFRS